MEVTSARMREGGWQNWLLWAGACADHHPEDRAAHQPVIDMLVADGGEFLGFTLVTARRI